MKPILLLDIDQTLINTEKFKFDTSTSLSEYLNTSTEQFNEVSQRYISSLKYSSDFNYQTYLRTIADSYDRGFPRLEKIFLSKTILSHCLFPETKRVLRKLSKKYTLGIYSEGFLDFQTKKLIYSGIAKYFSRKYIFIFRRKTSLENIRKLPKKSTVIDNELSVLKRLSKHKNIKTYWLNRENKRGDTEISTIHKLTDIS